MLNSILSLLALGAFVHSLPTFPPLTFKRQDNVTNAVTNDNANAIINSIPQWALDHAPLLWLDTDERCFPSDIASQLPNTYPTLDQTPIANPPSPRTLDNLDNLNGYGNDGGRNVYLHSNEGITTYQTTPWFTGVHPASDRSTPGAIASTIIFVPKEGNILDVFYFSFYAFNQGNLLFETPNLEFGNHVGDWEHTAIRFDTSTEPPSPKLMWFSQHSYGQAFDFNVLEKDESGKRPYVYVARGTHANYAIPGPHNHVLPNGWNTVFGPLIDHTSRGTLWDPTLNTYLYSYSAADDKFIALPNSSTSAAPPTNWLYFNGKWGDPTLPNSAPGQTDLFGQHRFEGGPTGPRDKNLGRKKICPDGKECVIRPILVPKV